jgi:uncharacterized protein YqeY
VDALRMIKAGVQRVAIEKRQDTLDDQGVAQVISQQVKQRKETLESAKTAGRQDVVTQTEAELKLLTAYLPEQLSEDAIRALIAEAIAAVGPQQGLIMKHVMGKAAGAADGKTVSRLVAEQLKKPA